MEITPGMMLRRVALLCRVTSAIRSLTAGIPILKSYSSLRLFPRLIVAALALCCLACGQQAKVVSDEIDSQGATSVVKKLNSGDGSQWQAVIRGIETGSPQWLEVAMNVLTATDAVRT